MWVHLPLTSCLSAQAQEDSNSDSVLQSQRLEQFATLNGKLLPAKYWQRAWQTRSSMKRLSGLTLEPSMASRGVASFIALLRDTRASHSRSAAKEKEKTTPDICGHVSLGSSTKSLLPLYCLKTSQIIFPLDFRRSEPNYEQWVTTLRRDSSLRLKLVRRTFGKGFSFWGTPRADPSGKGNSKRAAKRRLEDLVAEWIQMAQKKDRLKKFFRQVQTNGKNGKESLKTSLRINPHFLTRMMNWPRGWINPSLPIDPQEFASWEMASYQLVRRMLFVYSVRES